MEHVKEHGHTEASERIDERRQQHYCKNQTSHGIQDVEDEVPHQESRYQNRSDQCQQCGVFERHGRSMNGAGVIRKRTFRFT
jgi:hypothetical protein